jgi:hypothetical protein
MRFVTGNGDEHEEHDEHDEHDEQIEGKHTHKIHTGCPRWPDSPTQLNHKEETPRVVFLVRDLYAWDRIPSGEETKQGASLGEAMLSTVVGELRIRNALLP